MKKTAQQKAFEKWSISVLENLARVLLLEDFHPIEISYKKLDQEINAECDFIYPYKSICIYYGDNLLEDFSKKDYTKVKNSLAHEMCHPLTDPIYSKAITRYASRNEISDERERLTDHIANIVLRNKLL